MSSLETSIAQSASPTMNAEKLEDAWQRTSGWSADFIISALWHNDGHSEQRSNVRRMWKVSGYSAD